MSFFVGKQYLQGCLVVKGSSKKTFLYHTSSKVFNSPLLDISPSFLFLENEVLAYKFIKLLSSFVSIYQINTWCTYLYCILKIQDALSLLVYIDPNFIDKHDYLFNPITTTCPLGWLLNNKRIVWPMQLCLYLLTILANYITDGLKNCQQSVWNYHFKTSKYLKCFLHEFKPYILRNFIN